MAVKPLASVRDLHCSRSGARHKLSKICSYGIGPGQHFLGDRRLKDDFTIERTKQTEALCVPEHDERTRVIHSPGP